METLPELTELKLSALDTTSNGIVITNASGEIIWVNPAFSQMTGYGSDEVVGKNPRILKSGKNPPAVYQELWHTITSGLDWKGKLINRRKDGTLYTEIEAITPIRRAGHITHFIAIKQDISALAEAEEKARSSAQFLDLIFDHIPNMIFVKDAKNLNFVRINKAGQVLLGLSAEEVVGKSVTEFFSKEQAEFFIQKDKQVIENKTPVDIPEELVNTKFHGQRILHTKKVPMLDEEGVPAYLLGISEDITESKKSLAQLQQSLNDLKRINAIMVDRELKMIELKGEIDRLKKKYEP